MKTHVGKVIEEQTRIASSLTPPQTPLLEQIDAIKTNLEGLTSRVVHMEAQTNKVDEVRERIAQHEQVHLPPDLPEKVNEIEGRMESLHQKFKKLEGSLGELVDEEGC